MADEAKVEMKPAAEPAKPSAALAATVAAKDAAPTAKPEPIKAAEPVAKAAPKPADKPDPKAALKTSASAVPAAAAKAAAKTPAKVKPTAKAPLKTTKTQIKKPATSVAAKVAGPATQPFLTPLKQIKDKTMTMNDTLKKQAETAMTQGKAAAEQFQVKAKEAMEQGTKSMEEMNSFARGNVEAMVEAGRVAAKGLETVTQHVVDMAKKNAEVTSTAVRSFAGAKNANELVQLQSDFARTQFDKMVADGSKLTELFVKMAGEAFEPISNRFAVAADTFAKAGTR